MLFRSKIARWYQLALLAAVANSKTSGAKNNRPLQVELENGRLFFAPEVFEFATAASRASWYHLAIFESDFTNPASKHLLGFAQTRYSAQNCAGYTFPLIPNTQIFLEENLFYENRR